MGRETGNMESMVVEKDVSDKTVDREKTCPLLLRVFCNPTGRHHEMREYFKGVVPTNELQIYTWLDATLKELMGLVKEVNPDARRKGTYFDFSVVYPNLDRVPQGTQYQSVDIGTTCAGQKGKDDEKMLSETAFTIGDYLDVAITPPNYQRNNMGGGNMRGGRRNF